MTAISERDRIVDCAVELAERASWEAVRLHEVAARLNISLDDIRAHFREKEEIGDAFFDRADQAMLAAARAPGFETLTTREKLERLMLAWLDALAPHRHAARGMLLSKLEPGHLHVLVPAMLRTSRTVQWMREAAGRRQTFLCRAVEETATTGIFLATLACWSFDATPDRRRTRALLDCKLRAAERVARLLPATHPPAPTGMQVGR
jgi:AcrR family transcriptional regulator